MTISIDTKKKSFTKHTQIYNLKEKQVRNKVEPLQLDKEHL